MFISIKYFELKEPIVTSIYKKEIIKKQGDHEGKGYPFNKNGEGNQGYFFNLQKDLANFFFEKIIDQNPQLLKLLPLRQRMNFLSVEKASLRQFR